MKTRKKNESLMSYPLREQQRHSFLNWASVPSTAFRQDGDSRGQTVLKKNATTKLQSTVRFVIQEVEIIGCVQYMQNNTNKRLWMS